MGQTVFTQACLVPKSQSRRRCVAFWVGGAAKKRTNSPRTDRHDSSYVSISSSREGWGFWSQTTDTSKEDIASCSFSSKPNTDMKHKHATRMAHGNSSQAVFVSSHKITAPGLLFSQYSNNISSIHKSETEPTVCPLVPSQVGTDFWPGLRQQREFTLRVRTVISILLVDVRLID